MSDKDTLKHELKTAATVALTLGATTLGAPKASATEMDYDTQAKTEMYTPSAGYMENDADITFEACQNPSMYRSPDEYARAMGYYRDASLSKGVDGGNDEWSDYAGAYVKDPNVHGYVRSDDADAVMYLPRDMRETHKIRTCTRSEACQNPSMYHSPDEYARAMGYYKDARLSEGVAGGNNEWSGYAGAYVKDPYVHGYVRSDDAEAVMYLPRDMRESHKIRKCSRSYAESMKAEGREAYWQGEIDKHMGRGYYPGSPSYGGGINSDGRHLDDFHGGHQNDRYHQGGHHGGSRVGETLRRVDEAVHGVGQVVDGLQHIFGGGRGR